MNAENVDQQYQDMLAVVEVRCAALSPFASLAELREQLAFVEQADACMRTTDGGRACVVGGGGCSGR